MSEKIKEIWRFRLNWALTSFIVAVLYVSGIKDQFSSLHRYVTNPLPQHLNKTARHDVSIYQKGNKTASHSYTGPVCYNSWLYLLPMVSK